MFRALHTYKATAGNEHTLSFQQGEILCVLEKTNSSWWLASNETGQVGYIPNTYVQLYDKVRRN